MTSQQTSATPSTPRHQSKCHSNLLSQNNHINFPSLATLDDFGQLRKFCIIVSVNCPKFHDLVVFQKSLLSALLRGHCTASAAGDESATELTSANGIRSGAAGVVGAVWVGGDIRSSDSASRCSACRACRPISVLNQVRRYRFLCATLDLCNHSSSG